jgi:hypothetical protein
MLSGPSYFRRQVAASTHLLGVAAVRPLHLEETGSGFYSPAGGWMLSGPSYFRRQVAASTHLLGVGAVRPLLAENGRIFSSSGRPFPPTVSYRKSSTFKNEKKTGCELGLQEE